MLKSHKNLPAHIAIIMDGNGRWAKKRMLPRAAGHAVGAKTFENIARYGNKIGLKFMTVYAFSTENWSRPEDEVAKLMKLLEDYLQDANKFKHENIKVKFIGDINEELLGKNIVDLIRKNEAESADATGMQLNIALNYGGRNEILSAVKSIVKTGKNADDLTEEDISENIYTAKMPDPDLIIRPSGELRLSNFLLWQAAYAEFYFDKVLWPNFKPKHLEKAIKSYQKRNIRKGGI